MSTNVNTEETVAWEVEKGRKAAQGGRWDEALDHYYKVIERTIVSPTEGIAFQKIRALVNSAVLLGRRGDRSQAQEYLNQSVKLASLWGQSGRIQGAATSALINEVLLEENDSHRKKLFESLCKERSFSSFGEVHRLILPLFDPGQLLFFDKPDQGVTFDPCNPATVWLGKSLFSHGGGKRPADEEFFALYHNLSLSYKKGLVKNFPSLCQGFTPPPSWGPLYDFEERLWKAPHSPYPMEEILRISPQFSRQPIRSIKAYKEGWTWLTESGEVWFWSGQDPVKQGEGQDKLSCGQWNQERQEWGLVFQSQPQTVFVVSEKKTEQFTTDYPVATLVPGPGWYGVSTTGKWGPLGETTDSPYPELAREEWCSGMANSQWLYLGSATGKILFHELKGQMRSWVVSAHQGRVLTVIPLDQGLVSGGEDGRIIFWACQTAQGPQQRVEKKVDGPVFFAEQRGGYTALAGGHGLWLFTSQSEKCFTYPGEIQGMGMDSRGQLLWSDKKNQVHGALGTLRAHTNWVVAMAFHEKKKTWVTACMDGTVCEWSGGGKLIRQTGWEPGRAVVLGPQFSAVLTQTRIVIRDTRGKVIEHLSFEGEPLLEWHWNRERTRLWFSGLNGSFMAVDFSSRKTRNRFQLSAPVVHIQAFKDRVMAADSQGSLHTFFEPTPGGKRAHESVNWDWGRLGGARFGENHRALLWNPAGKKLYVYDGEKKTVICSLDGIHKKEISDGLWEEDRLWTVGKDGKLVTWNISEVQLESILRDEREPLEQLYATRRVMVVRTAGKNWLLCHRGSKTEVEEIPGHRSHLTDLVIHPREDFLVTAGEDRSLRFFKLPDGQFVQKIPLEGLLPTSLSFAPQGDSLAVLCQDGSLVYFKMGQSVTGGKSH